MKHCLLCDHKEPGPSQQDVNVDYICSQCIQDLVRLSQTTITERYMAAIKEKKYKIAYALSLFVPKHRRQNIPYTGRRARRKS